MELSVVLKETAVLGPGFNLQSLSLLSFALCNLVILVSTRLGNVAHRRVQAVLQNVPRKPDRKMSLPFGFRKTGAVQY